MMKNRLCDLHLHTNASDGTESVAVVIDKAYDKGLRIISITDHDTVAAQEKAQSLSPTDMQIIPGVEFSCFFIDGDRRVDCHILAYFIDCTHKDILNIVRLGERKRQEKLMARIRYLKDEYGISIPDEKIAELSQMNAVAKPHLARVLMEMGYGDSVGEVINKYMSGQKTPDSRIDAEFVIKGIHNAGGMAVYAHPLGGEYTTHLTQEEVTLDIDCACRLGIDGIECYYSRYSPEEIDMLLAIARERGLLVSGGSDYHGENKTVPLGVLCSNGDMCDELKLSVLRYLE